MIRQLHGSALLPGFDRIRLPGEDRARRIEERRANGIPIPHELQGALDKMAGELGIARLFGCEFGHLTQDPNNQHRRREGTPAVAIIDCPLSASRQLYISAGRVTIVQSDELPQLPQITRPGESRAPPRARTPFRSRGDVPTTE